MRVKRLSPFEPPPTTEKGHLKHIHKEGARYHVISFTTQGERCSESNCAINHEPDYGVSDWVFVEED